MSHIFEQLPNESAKAFKAFRAYLELGPDRTYIATYRNVTGRKNAKEISGQWRTWIRDFCWEQREKAWDAWIVGRREEKFITAWESQRDRMLEQARLLSDRADQMLKHPLVVQQVKKTVVTASGEEVATEIHLKPARWTAGDAARYYQTAVELMRAAIGDVDLAIELLERNGYQVTFKPQQE